MGYYDGNTVTALWNYAQHYAMNDHSFSTTFGPSTPGAINLVSGQTNGVINALNPGTAVVADGNGGLTLTSAMRTRPATSAPPPAPTSACPARTSATCSTPPTSPGAGLRADSTSTVTNANGTTGCARSTGAVNIPRPPAKADYIPHHQPFQYYASTANLNHTRPTSSRRSERTDAANHQYDMHDFTDALAAGNMPAVSFLKAPGLSGRSRRLLRSPRRADLHRQRHQRHRESSFWSSTAIIIAYDDSDGWYDHLNDFINGSATTADALNGAGVCISAPLPPRALPGVNSTTLHAQGRCGYGPRLPFLVISPWAKKNSIDHTVTDQASITRFIEDIFLSSQRIGGGSFDSIAGTLTNMFNFTNGAVIPNPNVVLLNPTTGAVTSGN